MKRDLEETLRRYLETIKLFLRPNTVINSRTCIADFIRYLETQHPEVSSFCELERSHIVGWLGHLARRPLKRSTRRNKIIKLRVFLESLLEWGSKDAPSSPLFRRGDLPPEDVCLPRPLSEETDLALKDEFGRRGGFLHKSLLLLRATGLRAQEFMDLEVTSLRKLSGDDWELHVPVGKLHSERVLPIDPATARLFLDLRELRGNPLPIPHPETGKPTHFLFVRPSGRRYSRDALRYHLGKIEKEAALPEHPSPHRLRHTYATEMLRAGLHLPVLMKLMGHRTIGMTLRYARITQEDVRREYTKALELVQYRYDIPIAPPPHNRAAEVSKAQTLHGHITAAATALESRRRDLKTPSERKTIQRLVERLRRLAKDLAALPS